MSHLVFAYVSNLNATDLGRYTVERSLPAMYPKKVCNACLHDRCAYWTAHSKRRNSGALNIEPAKGHTEVGACKFIKFTNNFFAFILAYPLH